MSASPERNRFSPPPPPPTVEKTAVRVVQPFTKEGEDLAFDFRPKAVQDMIPEDVHPKGAHVSSDKLGLTEAESIPVNPQPTLFDQAEESVTDVKVSSITSPPPPPLSSQRT